MIKIIVIIAAVLLLVCLFPVSISGRADGVELSVVDATDIADLIVKSDTVHFIVHVQTNGEIRYSQELREGTYIVITDESNTTSYTFQFNNTESESPYNNFYRLHYYLDTGLFLEGRWYYFFHVELVNGTSANSATSQFSVRDSDDDPVIIDSTGTTFSTQDNIVISARITDPDGDAITKVEVVINETTYLMEMNGDLYTKNIGMMPSNVDSFTYQVYTGRKKDGDTAHSYREIYNIEIKDTVTPSGDNLPVATDRTQLPDKVLPESILMFKASYLDEDGDAPEKVEMNIFNRSTGALLYEAKLLTEGGSYTEGVEFYRSIRLSEINITLGEWGYKLKYRYNGSDFIINQTYFTVVFQGSDTPPDIKDFTNIAYPRSKKDTVEFIAKWKDAEGDTPDEISVRIFEEGELISKKRMILSGTGDWNTYTVSINLSNLDINGQSIEYDFAYGYLGNDRIHPGDTIVFREKTSVPDENIWIIVLVILITIIILLSLFVFTFGKRDPY